MKNLTIYNEDCLLKMQEMVDESIKVNAIITDPPYAIARKTGFSTGNKKEEYIKKYGNHSNEFGEWDNQEIDYEKFLDLSYQLLQDGGTLLMFYDIWKIQSIKEAAERLKFKQPRIGFWVKSNPVPINSKLNYLTNSKEAFITFVRKSKPTFNSKYDNAIYTYPICSGKERTKHTTQKPLQLMEDLILKHTNKGDIVLDPFMGSGSTGEACLNNERKFIGIEKESEYYRICEERLNKNIDIDEW